MDVRARLRGLLSRKLVRWASVLVGVVLVLLFGVCTYFRIWSREDIYAFRSMPLSYDPIWKPLALRQIREGDMLEVLLRSHPPKQVEAFGPYTLLSYHEPMSFVGINVVGRDNRLVYAGAFACTWRHRFFSNEEAEHIWASYSLHLRGKIRERDLDRLGDAVAAGRAIYSASITDDGSQDLHAVKAVLTDWRNRATPSYEVLIPWDCKRGGVLSEGSERILIERNDGSGIYDALFSRAQELEPYRQSILSAGQ